MNQLCVEEEEEAERLCEDESTMVYCLKGNLTLGACGPVGSLEQAGMLLDIEAEDELGAETLESPPCSLDLKKNPLHHQVWLVQNCPRVHSIHPIKFKKLAVSDVLPGSTFATKN